MSRNSTTFSTNTEVCGFTSYKSWCYAGFGSWTAMLKKGNHYSVADLTKESWMLMCSRTFTFEIRSEWWFSMRTYTESKKTFVMSVGPNPYTSDVMGWANGCVGSRRLDLLLNFLDQPNGVCGGSSCWSQSTVVFEVPPEKVLAGRCVQTKLLIWLRACFLRMPWGTYGENDVWEQTDMQSPWVIPCVPSMLFCLLGWDANIMNFN